MYEIAICDDEEAFSNQLEKNIRLLELPFDDEISFYIFEDGKDMIESLRSGFKPNMVFLDIEMKQMNGIQTADRIRNEFNDNEMAIIFVTSYDEYDRELFKFHPFGFVSKNGDMDELKKYVMQGYENGQKKAAIFEYINDYKSKCIPCNEILYFKKFMKEVDMILLNNESDWFSGSIKELYSRLPKEMFVQINQSEIINIYQIQNVDDNIITMKDKSVHKISRKYKNDVNKAFMRAFFVL